jgi:cell division protein FtsW (lipid II flippase)
MPILEHLRKLSSWFLIFTLLYLSIDGVYIISTVINEIPEKKAAIEHIRIIISFLLMLTTGFLILFRYSFGLFKNSLIHGFLSTFIYLLLLFFSFMGNFEITFYICLIYMVLNTIIIFAQKIIGKKYERINLGIAEKKEFEGIE